MCVSTINVILHVIQPSREMDARDSPTRELLIRAFSASFCRYPFLGLRPLGYLEPQLPTSPTASRISRQNIGFVGQVAAKESRARGRSRRLLAPDSWILAPSHPRAPRPWNAAANFS
jgi:hypothetical protein